jgi:hypothetical protein
MTEACPSPYDFTPPTPAWPEKGALKHAYRMSLGNGPSNSHYVK